MTTFNINTVLGCTTPAPSPASEVEVATADAEQLRTKLAAVTSERDSLAADLDATVQQRNEFAAKLAEVEKERDELQDEIDLINSNLDERVIIEALGARDLDDKPINRSYVVSVICRRFGNDLAEARESSKRAEAEVTRIRDIVSPWLDTAERIDPNSPRHGSQSIVDMVGVIVDAMNTADMASGDAQVSAQRAEADAAAMRELADDVYKLTTMYPRPYNNAGYELSNRITLACKKVLAGTAGRELIDEMKRDKDTIKAKEAEIAYLRQVNASQADGLMNDRDAACKRAIRFEHKARTAKAALVETYRGKLDPAWFVKSEKVWQYRRTKRDNDNYWRTSDGVTVFANDPDNRDYWYKSFAFETWQACCDDPHTYPCTADGKTLGNHQTQGVGHATVLSVPKSDRTKALEADSDQLRTLRDLLADREIDWRPSFADIEIKGGDSFSADDNRKLVAALIAIRDGGGK